MPTQASLINMKRWAARRDKWFAEHPKCVTCGKPDPRMKIIWAGPKEDKPFSSMLEAFRRKPEAREAILAQCQPQCYNCWRPTRKINEHGGGKTGIYTCKCDLCVEKRRTHAREYDKQQTIKWQQRREQAKAKGIPTPVRSFYWRNEWNNTEKGKLHRQGKRKQAREEWLKGRSCTDCGATKKLTVAFIELPGPLSNAGIIWSYGKEARARFLEKCHTLCVPCRSRRGHEGRK